MPIFHNLEHILLWVLVDDPSKQRDADGSRINRTMRLRSSTVITGSQLPRELSGSSKKVGAEGTGKVPTFTLDPQITVDQRMVYFILSYTNLWSEKELWDTLKSMIQQAKITPAVSILFIRRWLSLSKLPTSVLLSMLSFYNTPNDFVNELKLATLRSHRKTNITGLPANPSGPLITAIVDAKKMALNPEFPLNLRQRWSPKETAKELCLMERETMLAIPPAELATLAWTHSADDQSILTSKRVRESIEIFNRISNLVIIDILYARSAQSAIETVEYYIEVAHRLYKYKNYNTLTAVVSSFSRWQVDRVKNLWTQLSPGALKKLSVLNSFISSEHNYLAYRETLTKDNAGIPIMSVILRDLIHICEGNPAHYSDKSLNLERLLLLGKGISVVRGSASLYSRWKSNVELRSYLLITPEINDDILLEKSRLLNEALQAMLISPVSSISDDEPTPRDPLPTGPLPRVSSTTSSSHIDKGPLTRVASSSALPRVDSKGPLTRVASSSALPRADSTTSPSHITSTTSKSLPISSSISGSSVESQKSDLSGLKKFLTKIRLTNAGNRLSGIWNKPDNSDNPEELTVAYEDLELPGLGNTTIDALLKEVQSYPDKKELTELEKAIRFYYIAYLDPRRWCSLDVTLWLTRYYIPAEILSTLNISGADLFREGRPQVDLHPEMRDRICDLVNSTWKVYRHYRSESLLGRTQQLPPLLRIAPWTKYDVVAWLSFSDMEKYRDVFLWEEIDGSTLSSMTDKDFETLGVTALGHRVKIRNLIKALASDAPSEIVRSPKKKRD